MAGSRRHRLAIIGLLCIGLLAWVLVESRESGDVGPLDGAEVDGPGDLETRDPDKPSLAVVEQEPGARESQPTEAVRVRGRIVDAEGQPVVGLSVLVDTPGLDPIPSNEQGRFEINGLSAGRHVLQPYDDEVNWQGEEHSFEFELRAEPHDVTLVAPRRLWMGGQVVDENGEPVASLSLSFRHASGMGFSHAFIATDEQGRFRVGMREPGMFIAEHLRVVLDGRCESGREDATLVYRPQPPTLMRIRIVGPNGVLVPRVQLQVLSGSGSTRSGGVYDVRGGVHIEDTASWGKQTQLQVAYPHGEEGNALPLGCKIIDDVDRSLKELEIRLPPGRSVEGVVLSEDGEAVAGVAVDAAYGVGHGLSISLARVWSDEAGRITLTGLPPERVRIKAVTQGTPWAWSEAVFAEPGQKSVNIRLHKGIAFAVHVRDPAGEPVAGVPVTLTWGVAGNWGHQTASTSKEGVALVEGLAPGALLDVHLMPRSAGLPFPMFSAKGIPSERREMVVELREGLEIRGTVVTAEGLPFSKGEVFAVATSARTHGYTDIARPDPKTGAFTLTRLATGPYRVHVRPDILSKGRSMPVVIDPPFEGLRIVMPRTVSVTGRLHVNDGSGWAIRWIAEPQGAQGVVGTKGDFKVPYVADREGHLWAVHASSGYVALLEGVHPKDGPFDLRPRKGLAISGRVEGPGKPASGEGIVYAVRGSLRLGRALVESDGSFTVGPLSPGSWTIELYAGLQQRAARPGVAAGTQGLVLRVPR